MKKFTKYLPMLIICFGIMGCTSIPHVDHWIEVEEGKYDVVVDNDYLYNQPELNYAFNSFAQEIGITTYTIKKYGPNDFYVTTPGNKEVEDLPEVKHFHGGRTAAAIMTPMGIGLLLLTILFSI